jgi:hypothetical protein
MSRADPAGVAAAGAGYLSHSSTKRAEYLGTVQATDERAAEAAIAAFELDEHRRKRLVVRFAKASKAPATRAAYVRFSDFRAWCRPRGLRALPATAESLCAFLADEASAAVGAGPPVGRDPERLKPGDAVTTPSRPPRTSSRNRWV